MKTLKESILKSVKAGKYAIEEEVKEWFENNYYFQNFKRTCCNDATVSVKQLEDGRFWIDITAEYAHMFKGRAVFTEKDLEKNNFVYKIAKITKRRDLIDDITYEGLTFKNTKGNIVDAIHDTLYFDKCTIGTLDFIPEGCKYVHFKAISKEKGCQSEVNKIENVRIWFLKNGEGCGFDCKLKNIKNCVFPHAIEISDYQFESDVLFEPSKKYVFTEEATKELKQLFKHNRIDATTEVIYKNRSVQAFKDYRFYSGHVIFSRKDKRYILRYVRTG